MKIELPQLDLSENLDLIRKNRDIINSVRKTLNSMKEALDGFAKANQAMCKHERKQAEYDPGYAGGGFSNYHCPDCDSRRC